jgi:exodeoxyribonuclease-5
MLLTAKQEEGLKIAVKRFRDHEPYTCIAGYAGTGKSTLIRFIISALNLDPEDVCYVAYTGKAAQVLRSKGCPNAMTAHRLLYKSIQKDDGTFYHIPLRPIIGFNLIVVDEISMLPKHMWELLLSHKIHVIALGDPGQLPPVLAEDNGVLAFPHIFLDEVMRQAAESEIIRLTMDIREGNSLKPFLGNEVRIVGREELLEPGFLAWGDQIICGKNETRHQINTIMRKIKMQTDQTEPLIGDRIICLHNEWECINLTGDALVNGLSGTITGLEYTNDNPFMEKTPLIDFKPDIDDSDTFKGLEADYKIFTEHVPTVTKETFKKIPKFYRPKEFDYGYCITCHKSQGSEYDKVIVLEEYLRGESKDGHSRWLYTAATRAAKKLIIVRNY